MPGGRAGRPWVPPVLAVAAHGWPGRGCDEESGASDAGASVGGASGPEGERSVGEESEDTDGAGTEGSDEEDTIGEGPVGDEISSLAQVELVQEESADGTVPADAAAVLLAQGYPERNLPPKTGISLPMLVPAPTFIRTVPEEPEPLYVAPESLFDDIVRLEADRISKPESVRNRTVYDSVEAQPSSDPGGGGAPIPQSQEVMDKLPPYYVPTGPEDTTLVFESRFESGNLRRAVQVYEHEYDLILNPDYNTKSHTQWYLFRVGNTRKGPAYRFNILNMQKPTSVYNDGMRPLQYSNIQAAVHGVGWVRCGDQIVYYQNGVRRKDKSATNYYTLTFTVTFDHDDDLVYFSHCYPYNYTDLQNDLRELESDPMVSRRFRRRKLCDTLAGNACDLITITSFCSNPAALRARRAVVITARVHPGESNASWVMKGMLDYLTGPSLDARILRDNFVFKIIPMLNPDGVIVGNYRCSLTGQDLNRLWDDPSRKTHPTIFFAKSMIKHLSNDREVILYIDIHGHSRKKNVFMYGNCESSGVREKVFPGLLCRNSDCFNFDDCCFKVQTSKESTARVVAYRELAIVNSFTLEASFCGADFGPLADQHFTTKHLEEMGYLLCDAILDFCDPDQTKVMQVVKELQLLYPDDGNSDDVSDSEDDGAAAARARRRSKPKKVKREKGEKAAPKKKASAKSRATGDRGAAPGEAEGAAATEGAPRESREARREVPSRAASSMAEARGLAGAAEALWRQAAGGEQSARGPREAGGASGSRGPSRRQRTGRFREAEDALQAHVGNDSAQEERRRPVIGGAAAAAAEAGGDAAARRGRRKQPKGRKELPARERPARGGGAEGSGAAPSSSGGATERAGPRSSSHSELRSAGGGGSGGVFPPLGNVRRRAEARAIAGAG